MCQTHKLRQAKVVGYSKSRDSTGVNDPMLDYWPGRGETLTTPTLGSFIGGAFRDRLYLIPTPTTGGATCSAVKAQCPTL